MDNAVAGNVALASTFQVTQNTAGYDLARKKVMHHKEILAIIMSFALEEYQNYSLEEIMDFIEQDSINSPDLFGECSTG